MIHRRPAAATSTTLAGLVALAISPACGGGTFHPTLHSSDGGGDAFHPPAPPSDGGICPATSSPAMPRALIGPDVDVDVFCWGSTMAPIASVDELGAGVTRWSFTIQGAAAFGPLMSQTFETSQATSPQVAFVGFNAPPDAPPGSTFDAIATVHAADGSFADGQVKLHGQVVTPVVTVDKTSIDFGDVGPGEVRAVALDFTLRNGTGLSIVPVNFGPTSFGEPFSVSSVKVASLNVRRWNVAFQWNVPGDYSAAAGWRAVPTGLPNASSACNWTTTITLHARVVDDGGVSGDDTADANDGGTDLAPDAP